MTFFHARLLGLLSASALICGGFAPQERISDLQARFDRETNSVHKAKLFDKLGDEEFAETRRASRANDYQTVGQVLEKYRDNARAAMAALKKEHPNAERQTAGYKQLQMHIHRGLRELDETLVIAPQEFRPPLLLVRQDLVALDDELLQMLFPRRPPPKSAVLPPPPVPPEKQP